MKQSIRTKSPFQQREKPAILQDKPPFQHIRKPARTRDGQRVTRQDIARLTGLSLGEVYIVDIGGCSARPHFQKVLQAFNKLTGQRLTIDDIRRAGVV